VSSAIIFALLSRGSVSITKTTNIAKENCLFPNNFLSNQKQHFTIKYSTRMQLKIFLGIGTKHVKTTSVVVGLNF
jgi:hypothetical protein